MKPRKTSHHRIITFYHDGFSIQELAIMYNSTPRLIEAVLEDGDKE